jgi:starch phosphorylase
MKMFTYTVKPKIPPALAALEEIAHNLWLSWNFDAIMLFIRLDYDGWMQSHQNPARMLGMVSQARYEQMSQDDSYLAALKFVYDKFEAYKEGDTWYSGDRKNSIAYFSMEYGLDVSLPIYSGGLGILSGDHMKTCSDLGLPLVGVGLLYRQGYFKQYLNADGYQQEQYPENDWYNMPVKRCMDARGQMMKISVELGGQIAIAQIWEAQVGRSKIYLLDTNIDENSPDLKTVTATLYGGDKEARIRQEILLGIGGIRALRALGINPAVTHMNEGHSAFLSFERMREFMAERGFSFLEAQQAVWPTNIFTTHTPVPAGNERFPVSLVERYFKAWAEEFKIDWRDFLALGRERPDDPAEDFCMTVLALKTSAYSNGVSRLHGAVSRKMWRSIWPDLGESEIPISSITNGVHPRTWISNTMLDLLDRYFGPRFTEEPSNKDLWDRMNRISDEELWRAHERRRERMVVFARDRLRQQMRRNGSGEAQLQRAEDVLSPYVLTIAFARRFATYKRGNLLLRDPERLFKILSDNDRPVQVIFAGKAHPNDLAGKELIKSIVHFAQNPELRSRIVFVEDYDMTMARYLTSGADVWLNNPRRPLEASGTSGMKAAMNGVLNCSVLDGWWDEAYSPECGWAIGKGEIYEDEGLQDEIESKALYDLLEREIVPLFYARGRDGLPRDWIKKMKSSMRVAGKDFSSHRMLVEYSEKFYFPALANYTRLVQEDFRDARELAAYLKRVRSQWPLLRVLDVSSDSKPIMERGDKITVKARLNLGGLSPEDLCVELYHGAVSAKGEFTDPERAEMKPTGKSGSDWEYGVEMTCSQTGCQGHTVRILPRHRALAHPFLPGLVRWA